MTIYKHSLLLVTLAVAGMLMGSVSADEPEAPRVEWSSNLSGSYQQALRENKPLIVLFWSSRCAGCRGPCLSSAKLVSGPLNSPEFHAHADRGVFVEVDIEHIERSQIGYNVQNARQMMDNLKIASYPTLVVNEAKIDVINEIGRIEGAMDTESYLRQFLPLIGQGPAAPTAVTAPH